jgi:hypothetical protein
MLGEEVCVAFYGLKSFSHQSLKQAGRTPAINAYGSRLFHRIRIESVRMWHGPIVSENTRLALPSALLDRLVRLGTTIKARRALRMKLWSPPTKAAYIERHRSVAATQFTKAGVRLTDLLNNN